jgi:hypothetical protein
MSPTLRRFVLAMRADPRYAAFAGQFAEAFTATDIESDGNLDALKQLSVLEWITDQASKTVEQRIVAMHKVVSLEGKVEIRLPQFLEW